jgi:hypothetical protein
MTDEERAQQQANIARARELASRGLAELQREREARSQPPKR